MKLYRIADWDKHYEMRDTKRIDGPLKWIPVTTKTDGFGFGMIRMQKNAPELLAAWYLMLGIAAKQAREDRGKLMRDGNPLTACDLALMTGFPERIFDAAFSFFSNPRQGWLVAEDLPKMPQPAAKVCSDAASCGEFGVQDRTGQEKTEQNKTGEDRPDASGPRNDSQWLDSLAGNPAYKHVAVKTEHAKMLVWCSAHNRKPTRRRFVSWLNRCEVPLNFPTGAQKPANSIPEPEGWRNWINENAPNSVYARGGTHEGERWERLDASTQRWIAGKIGERGAA